LTGIAIANDITQTNDFLKIEKGQKAPFSGRLFTRAAIAEIITGYEAKIKILELDIIRLNQEAELHQLSSEKICDVRVVESVTKHSSCMRDMARQKTIYDKAIDGCHQSSWYKSPFVTFLTGNLVAGGFCAMFSNR
jgi:hypothetical protein